MGNTSAVTRKGGNNADSLHDDMQDKAQPTKTESPPPIVMSADTTSPIDAWITNTDTAYAASLWLTLPREQSGSIARFVKGGNFVTLAADAVDATATTRTVTIMSGKVYTQKRGSMEVRNTRAVSKNPNKRRENTLFIDLTSIPNIDATFEAKRTKLDFNNKSRLERNILNHFNKMAVVFQLDITAQKVAIDLNESVLKANSRFSFKLRLDVQYLVKNESDGELDWVSMINAGFVDVTGPAGLGIIRFVLNYTNETTPRGRTLPSFAIGINFPRQGSNGFHQQLSFETILDNWDALVTIDED
jgi:hypothetical protein